MKKIFRFILILLCLPAFIAYEFTMALIVMPLIYGKRKWGIIGYIPLWLIYFSIIPITLIPTLGRKIGYLNNAANWCMGYPFENPVSKQVGYRIKEGTNSWVEMLHCRIFGVFDGRGYHCHPNARSLF